MTVELAGPDTDAAWRAFVDSMPDATPYHLPEWRRAAGMLSERSLPLMARDNSGDVTGVLPLFEVSGFRGRSLVSVPLRDRGGPLFADEDSLEALLSEATGLAQARKARSLQLRSHVRLPERVMADAGFVETTYHVTTTVELDEDVDAVLSRVKGSARRSAKKGADGGLEFRWGAGQEDVSSFFGLFLRTRRKLGVPPYPRAFFETMWEAMGADGNVRIGLASLDGTDVAGVFLFAFGDRVIDGYAASHEAHLDLQPNDFLIWNVLQHAARDGFRYFDFGASSPHQKGLLFFKEKWGGVHSELWTYTYPATAAMPPTDSNRSEFDLARKVWRMLPLGLTEVLGRQIVKRLD